MPAPLIRLRKLAQAKSALQRIETKARCEASLLAFVQYVWPVVEPATRLVLGKPLEAICEHLEAVTRGEIQKLGINVPPGSMKSLLVDVLWPAWEWTKRPSLRYVAFSYSAGLTQRDNRKFMSVCSSPRYQKLWGDKVKLLKVGEELVTNTATGSKLASSVGGVGTGERGDRILADDLHNVKEAESQTVRRDTVEWFSIAMSNRLNDLRESAIVLVMQRVHEEDVSGFIMAQGLPYEWLILPCEYEPDRKYTNGIGWTDWRTVEGESYWPERVPQSSIKDIKRTFNLSPYAYAGQYQQRPEPKGGAIILREWWQPWTAKVYPIFDYIVASIDPAYGEKQENDFSAITIWGVFNRQLERPAIGDARLGILRRTEMENVPSVILIHAWQGRVPLHELLETTVKMCRKQKVDRILIEAKASGMSLRQELARLYSSEDWGVHLINPGAQDKVARAHSISHLFSEGMIYAPKSQDDPEMWMDWADTVISQAAIFPRSAHDDLVDSTTQALRHLRDLGVLTRSIEREEEYTEMARYKGPPPQPLYPS